MSAAASCSPATPATHLAQALRASKKARCENKMPCTRTSRFQRALRAQEHQCHSSILDGYDGPRLPNEPGCLPRSALLSGHPLHQGDTVASENFIQSAFNAVIFGFFASLGATLFGACFR